MGRVSAQWIGNSGHFGDLRGNKELVWSELESSSLGTTHRVIVFLTPKFVCRANGGVIALGDDSYDR